MTQLQCLSPNNLHLPKVKFQMDTPLNKLYIQATFRIIDILELARNSQEKISAFTSVKKNEQDKFLTLTVDEILLIMHENYRLKDITKEMIEEILAVAIGGYGEIWKADRLDDNDVVIRRSYWIRDKSNSIMDTSQYPL